MESKSDDNLKNRKKPEEPAKSDTPEPAKSDTPEPAKRKEMWEVIKPKLANPNVQKAIYLTVALLFITALILILLYFLKLYTITEKFRAATKIHLFMQKYNDSLKGKKPLQTFKGAEEAYRQLQKLHARNNEVQKSIDGIVQKIKAGWVPYGGHLYRFYNNLMTFRRAKAFCERNNTELPEVHSDEDQDFIVEEIFRNEYACWTGLTCKNRKWTWISGGVPKKFFWSKGRPVLHNRFFEVCMDIHVCPKSQRPNCWNDVECQHERRVICRMKPDPRWL